MPTRKTGTSGCKGKDVSEKGLYLEKMCQQLYEFEGLVRTYELRARKSRHDGSQIAADPLDNARDLAPTPDASLYPKYLKLIPALKAKIKAVKECKDDSYRKCKCGELIEFRLLIASFLAQQCHACKNGGNPHHSRAPIPQKHKYAHV